MGVRIGGVDKITYNHFDSYPSGLGESIVSDVRALLRDPGIDGFKQLATALRVVDEQTDKPTDADIARLKQFTDLAVSERSEQDWYCLTRHLQGEFAMTLKVGLMIDSHNFMANSLFCEFAYIVNLDEMSFECYRGFQHAPHQKGRYANMERSPSRSDYWPVALVGNFDLADIPQNWDEQAFPEDEE
jgi:hypothetical protein